MDDHVDLQTSTTTLAVGDTVTIENIAKTTSNCGWSGPP